MARAEPIIVSYSELDTFRQCPLKHHLAYKMRYKKPPKPDSALAKGSLYHMVMEAHYRVLVAAAQADPKKRIQIKDEKKVLAEADKIVKNILWDRTRGEWISEIAELIYWMYQGYVGNYGADLQWRVLAVEHNIVTPLRDRRGRRSRYHLKAKIDLLVRAHEYGDNIFVVDHKSGQNLPTQMDLEIDDQFGLYQWAMKQMGKPVQGSLHSANRTQRNKGPMSYDSRMSRTVMSRSDKELVNLALDAYEAARAAYAPEPYTARYSSPDPRSCGWKCDFKEPHLLMRKGRQPDQVLREYGFVIDRTRH